MWLMYQNTENLAHKEVPKWQHVSVHRHEPRNILNRLDAAVIVEGLGQKVFFQ